MHFQTFESSKERNCEGIVLSIQDPVIALTGLTERIFNLVAKRKSESAAAHSGESSQVQGAAKKMGRPPGKRSDPDYTQVTAYMRKDTYQAAQKLLIDLDRDFSDLPQDLVNDWVRKRFLDRGNARKKRRDGRASVSGILTDLVQKHRAELEAELRSSSANPSLPMKSVYAF
jgi:hypothetical protein